MAQGRIITDRSTPFPRTRVTGVSPRFYEDIYHFVLTRSWTQFIAALLFLYVLINALFGALYELQPGCIANVHDYEDAFFFSVQTFGTIGYGGMAPVTHYGHVIVALEAFAGMLAVAIVTGLTFAKFSRPTARVLFAQSIVIHERDGVPHLVFRLANQRHNMVVEATLHVIVLVYQRTKEGDELRTPIDLPLVRDRTALFALTWIPMHRIDEKSLFYGPDALERLRAMRAELFLSFQGHDETLAQTVHARWRYGLDDIKWGSRFADVLTIDDDGTRHIDYTRFHVVLPEKKEETS